MRGTGAPSGAPALPEGVRDQFLTAAAGRKTGKWRLPAALLAVCAAAAWADPLGAWPPFLPTRASFNEPTAAHVEQIWADFTFQRTVRGRPAHAPFELYVALVDTPDVAAAAARFKEISRDEVRAVGEDWFEASDPAGAHGFYRVLYRDATRRVLLSWGEHSGTVLGTIRGSALTVLTFEPREGAVEQELAAYVRIENAVAAAVARALVLIFGGFADRRLRESFAVGSRVAEWAATEPEAFCAWLTGAPLPAERKARVTSVVPGCGKRTRAAWLPGSPSR
jgi:hypothetical protein